MRGIWLGSVALLLAALGWPALRLVGLLAEHDEASGVLFARATWVAALHSAELAASAGGLACVVGVPLGLALARADLPRPALWRLLVLVPFAVPPWVLAIAWLDLLNPATGRLLPVFEALRLPSPDIYGPAGMIWVLGVEAVPLVALATADAASRVDPSLEEAARVAGAGRLRALVTATLPLAWPSAAAAAATAASGALAAWSVPYLLSSGSTRPWPVLATRIVGLLDADPAAGLPSAGFLALLLAAAGGVPLLLAARLSSDRGRVAVGGRGAGRRAARGGRVAALPVAAWCAVTALLPLGALAWAAVDGAGWARVVSRPEVRDAILRSVGLALAAGALAASLGALWAWAARRTDWRGRRAVLAVARAPWAVPGTALALVLLVGFSAEIRWVLFERVTLVLALGNTVWMLLVAYVLRFAAIPVGAVDAALSAVDPALEEAAAVAGAPPSVRATRVALPLVFADVLRGALLVSVAALSEVTLSVLLCGPSTRVVGTVAFDLLSYGDPAAAAALGLGLAAAGLLGVALAQSAARTAGAWS